MKKTTFLLLALVVLAPLSIYAKKEKKPFEVIGKAQVGTFVDSTKKIYADKFLFPTWITSVDIDRKTDAELVMLANKALACRLDSGKVLWQAKASGLIFQQPNAAAFLASNSDGVEFTTQCLSTIDGSKKWKANGFYPLIDNIKSDIIIGLHSYELRGLDANTGKTVWKRKLQDRDAGIPYYVSINDSIILLMNGGLHTVNLTTGEGWSHKIKTGNKSLKKAQFQRGLAMGVAGGLGGFIGGAAGAAISASSNASIFSYGRYHFEDDAIVYANEKEKVKISLADGTLLEQHDIANVGTDDENEDNVFFYTYKDFQFKYADNFIKIYLDNEELASLDIYQIVYVKDDLLYGTKADELYRIDLQQLN